MSPTRSPSSLPTFKPQRRSTSTSSPLSRSTSTITYNSMLRSSSPRQRQRLLRAVWFGLIGTLGLLWYYNNEHASKAIRSVVTSPIQKSLISGGRADQASARDRAYWSSSIRGRGKEKSVYCPVDDIALGTWEVHRQFDDLDSIKEAYKLFVSTGNECDEDVHYSTRLASPCLRLDSALSLCVSY
jgi:hypothetical protein